MAGRDTEDDVVSISSTHTFILDLPPSCIEFSPLNRHYFVVGTYYLETESGTSHKPAQDRRGSLMLFNLTDQALKLLQTVDLPYAVLDLHFSRFRKEVFAIATSKGAVCLCTTNINGNGPIEILNSYQIFSEDSLTLSLAWNPVVAQSDTIAASSSDGLIAIFDSKGQSPMIYTKTEAHSLEAWTLAWTYSKTESGIEYGDSPELYSGGDDSVLCRHGLCGRPVLGSPNDGNMPSPDYDFQAPIRDTKTHMAGVTAILPLQPVFHGEQVLLTGSYDEYVRLLLPVEGGKRPKLLAEKRLGGGVWRLKILTSMAPDHDMGGADSESLPGPAFTILASCMHTGAKILEVRQEESGKWLINVLANFMEHESMNYASDGRPRHGAGGVEGFTVVSTSFYDKKLCVWETKVD